MESRLFRVALALLLALAVAPAAAQTEEAEPRLYTNADLENLEPIPVDTNPIGPVDGSGWESVAEFLAREHARLESGRSHDLNRRLVAIEEEKRRGRSGYALTYPGYPNLYGYPYGHDARGQRHAPRAKPRHALNGRIVPLHARPTPAQLQRSRAIQRSGRDAFPHRAHSSH